MTETVKQRRIPLWLSGLFAVLILAGVVTLWRAVRLDGAARGPAGVTLLAPPAGAVPAERTAFHWRPVPGATAYLLEVLDQTDKVIVSGETGDTTLLMARAALPVTATSFRWRIVAYLADGSTVRSEERPMGGQ